MKIKCLDMLPGVYGGRCHNIISCFRKINKKHKGKQAMRQVQTPGQNGPKKEEVKMSPRKKVKRSTDKSQCGQRLNQSFHLLTCRLGNHFPLPTILMFCNELISDI